MGLGFAGMWLLGGTLSATAPGARRRAPSREAGRWAFADAVSGWEAHPPGSLLVCGPGSRSSPRPWGRGGRPCRRRQKRRRCESSGLRAPFLCPETESGVEGGRRSACRVLELPTSPPPPPLSRTCSDTRAVTSEDSPSFFLQAISSSPGKKKKRRLSVLGMGFFPSTHNCFCFLFFFLRG